MEVFRDVVGFEGLYQVSSPGDGVIRDGWYCCPNCGRKLFKVEPGALAEGISVKCKGTKEQKCGRVVHVKIKN